MGNAGTDPHVKGYLFLTKVQGQFRGERIIFSRNGARKIRYPYFKKQTSMCILYHPQKWMASTNISYYIWWCYRGWCSLKVIWWITSLVLRKVQMQSGDLQRETQGTDFSSEEEVALPHTGVGDKARWKIGRGLTAGTSLGCWPEPEAIHQLCDLYQWKLQCPHLQNKPDNTSLGVCCGRSIFYKYTKQASWYIMSTSEIWFGCPLHHPLIHQGMDNHHRSA